MAYQAPGANSARAAAMSTMPVSKKTAAVRSSQNFDRTLHSEEVNPINGRSYWNDPTRH